MLKIKLWVKEKAKIDFVLNVAPFEVKTLEAFAFDKNQAGSLSKEKNRLFLTKYRVLVRTTFLRKKHGCVLIFINWKNAITCKILKNM